MQSDHSDPHCLFVSVVFSDAVPPICRLLWYNERKYPKEDNMAYELSLEYGSYPVKTIDGFALERQTAPQFLHDNPALLDKIDRMNTLFHELFLTIECTFHYIGSNFPEKIARLRTLYNEVAEELTQTYPEQAIKIEYFILS